MRERIKPTKTEGILLGITAVFLCTLLALSHWDRLSPEESPAIRTETQVPPEELTPDFSPLDLNTATAEELMELPGIGEKLAQGILDYRAEHGAFQAVEEIMEISGIGPSTFAELEGRIAVKGERHEDLSGG